MRSKFVGDGVSIHCYEVQWDSKELSWEAFRGELLGPTDPKECPEGSIRKAILDNYKGLGLTSVPNKGDNGVHASASPFEGLAEKCNWLRTPLAEDAFGAALLSAGVPEPFIKAGTVDPQVVLPGTDGKKGSLFDALEDLDYTACLAKFQ